MQEFRFSNKHNQLNYCEQLRTSGNPCSGNYVMRSCRIPPGTWTRESLGGRRNRCIRIHALLCTGLWSFLFYTQRPWFAWMADSGILKVKHFATQCRTRSLKMPTCCFGDDVGIQLQSMEVAREWCMLTYICSYSKCQMTSLPVHKLSVAHTNKPRSQMYFGAATIWPSHSGGEAFPVVRCTAAC